MKLLSQIYYSIQRKLFPIIEEEIGPLSEKDKRFITICEALPLETLLNSSLWCGNGRKPKPLRPIAGAFIAKALWNLPTTRAIIDRLKADTTLRRLCGWENGPGEVPHEATFSRAFAHFTDIKLAERLHEQLISKHLGEEIIWHSATDATAIEAREKPHCQAEPSTTPATVQGKTTEATEVPPDNNNNNNNKSKGKRGRGRPRKGEEPPEPEPKRLERHLHNNLAANLLDMPDTYCTHGCKKNAKGHTDHWIGYKLHLSIGDGDIPLAAYLSGASMHDSQPAIILQQIVAGRTHAVLYNLKDAAYDAATIKAHSLAQGSVPIIDPNPRRSEKLPMDDDRAARYKARSSAERVNSHLKDNHGGRTVRVRGAGKVMSHLMFGLLVMSADALFRLL